MTDQIPNAISDDDLLEWAMSVRVEVTLEKEPITAIGGTVLDLRPLDALLHEIAERRGLYKPISDASENEQAPRSEREEWADKYLLLAEKRANDICNLCALLTRARDERDRYQEALRTIQQVVEDEAYKVRADQPPCKHTKALNDAYGIAEAALSAGGSDEADCD